MSENQNRSPKQLAVEMKTQDWYLSMLMRLDRMKSIVNALNRFYASKTESSARKHLDVVHRLEKMP